MPLVLPKIEQANQVITRIIKIMNNEDKDNNGSVTNPRILKSVCCLVGLSVGRLGGLLADRRLAGWLVNRAVVVCHYFHACYTSILISWHIVYLFLYKGFEVGSLNNYYEQTHVTPLNLKQGFALNRSEAILSVPLSGPDVFTKTNLIYLAHNLSGQDK